MQGYLQLQVGFGGVVVVASMKPDVVDRHKNWCCTEQDSFNVVSIVGEFRNGYASRVALICIEGMNIDLIFDQPLCSELHSTDS